MSLGLVSYDSSSEESDDEEPSENKLQASIVSTKPTVGVNPNAATKDRHRKLKNQYLGAGTDSKETESIVLPTTPRSISQEEDGEYNASKSKLALPPPKRKGSAIKIPAPALPEPDSDDDEIEEPQHKRKKSGKKISSLFAMLPQPKHATVKQTNRILIPHTLTKKVTKPSPKLQPKSSTLNSANEELLGEVEGDNFFSLESSAEKAQTSSSFLPTTKNRQSSNIGSSHLQNESDKKTPHNQGISTTLKSDVREGLTVSSNLERTKPRSGINISEMKANKFIEERGQVHQNQSRQSSKLVSASFETSRDGETAPQKKPNKLVTSIKPELNEEPLDFTSKKTPYGYQMLPSSGASSSSHPAHSAQPVEYGSTNSYDQQDYYHQQGADNYHYPASSDPATSYHGNTQDSSLIHDKAFQRVVGKGNIDPSTLNIIDVNADEHMGTVNAEDWMLKSMTEEKEAREELRKEQLPTHQQKRKHQITYLARQARERELELKNSWAQNRMTRKQTQAKYGF
ncbi:putative proline-rich protein PRCC [Apostichopus japonicus]|uniref:Putative proline-rich protein PRCC n=1 Tax=Stichopus japonicus TaxID=307972 RepID=A0A2G8KTX9_STIJA|nr:putative proline-rich protein PRCC [Apostichopus japonicus]